MAIPPRRPVRGHSLPDPAAAREVEPARRGPLRLRHPRRPRERALDGPVHGDGPGGRQRREHGPPAVGFSERHRRARTPRRAPDPWGHPGARMSRKSPPAEDDDLILETAPDYVLG